MVKALLSALLVLVAMSSTFGKYIPKTGKRIPQTLSRGWGDQLIWAQTYEEGLYWSRSSQGMRVPSLLYFTLLSDDSFIDKASNVYIHLYETTDKHLSPDGQYVPRIIFVDPTMTVRADIVVAPPTVCYAYEPSDLKLCKCLSGTGKGLVALYILLSSENNLYLVDSNRADIPALINRQR
uniref:Anterior gradient 2 n=1 Tax=Gouania willdenowi TaxID=441366 RepID=A0A8C5DLJ8_GOUWI